MNFSVFDKDRDEIIRKCLDNNLTMINVGTNLVTSEQVKDLAFKHSLYYAVGLHPINIDTGLIELQEDEKEDSFFEKEFDYEKYKELAKGAVAIGEIGLDYYYKPKSSGKKKEFKEKQIEVLKEQLDLAIELDLPVILHSRMAYDDMVEVLKEKKIKGVLHCYMADKEYLKKFLDLGLYIGYNGIIFKDIDVDFEGLIRETPMNRILIETDSPYLSKDKTFPNTPMGVLDVIEEISRVKEITKEEVISITTQNAENLFKIKTAH